MVRSLRRCQDPGLGPGSSNTSENRPTMSSKYTKVPVSRRDNNHVKTHESKKKQKQEKKTENKEKSKLVKFLTDPGLLLMTLGIGGAVAGFAITSFDGRVGMIVGAVGVASLITGWAISKLTGKSE